MKPGFCLFTPFFNTQHISESVYWQNPHKDRFLFFETAIYIAPEQFRPGRTVAGVSLFHGISILQLPNAIVL